MLLKVGRGNIGIGLALDRPLDDRCLVLARSDERDLARLHDRGDTHRYRFGRNVVLTEEIARRIAAGDCIERNTTRAGVGARARLVEPNVAGLADAEYLQVDAARFLDRQLVLLAFLLDVVARDVALRNVDVLRLDVDVVKEVLPHEPVVAVDALRLHRVILVEIERHDVGEIEALLAVHLDQLAVDADRGATGGEAENRVPAFPATLLDYLGNTLRDGAGDLVVLDDYYRDAFFRGWHVHLKILISASSCWRPSRRRGPCANRASTEPKQGATSLVSCIARSYSGELQCRAVTLFPATKRSR